MHLWSFLANISNRPYKEVNEVHPIRFLGSVASKMYHIIAVVAYITALFQQVNNQYIQVVMKPKSSEDFCYMRAISP